MTSRADIRPNQHGWRRLSYTCRCGWVDWGHALPGSATELKTQFDNERPSWTNVAKLPVTLNGEPAFVVVYGQSMSKSFLTVSTVRQYVVRKSLSPSERESAALGIFMHASMQFETLQSTFPFSKVSDSGFSSEDLVSNLIGFYSAFKGIPQSRMRQICGETSVRQSEEVWDTHTPNGLGAKKNRNFIPRFYPAKECDAGPACVAGFPTELTQIKPSQSGGTWVVLKRRFIDGFIVNANLPVDISLSGDVRVQRPDAQ